MRRCLLLYLRSCLAQLAEYQGCAGEAVTVYQDSKLGGVLLPLRRCLLLYLCSCLAQLAECQGCAGESVIVPIFCYLNYLFFTSLPSHPKSFITYHACLLPLSCTLPIHLFSYTLFTYHACPRSLVVQPSQGKQALSLYCLKTHTPLFPI